VSPRNRLAGYVKRRLATSAHATPPVPPQLTAGSGMVSRAEVPCLSSRSGNVQRTFSTVWQDAGGESPTCILHRTGRQGTQTHQLRGASAHDQGDPSEGATTAPSFGDFKDPTLGRGIQRKPIRPRRPSTGRSADYPDGVPPTRSLRYEEARHRPAAYYSRRQSSRPVKAVVANATMGWAIRERPAPGRLTPRGRKGAAPSPAGRGRSPYRRAGPR
jgi:hypothetical protein